MTKSKAFPTRISLGYTYVNLVLVDSKISQNIGEQQGCYSGGLPYTVYFDKDIIRAGGPDAVNLVLHELMHHVYANYQVDEKSGEEVVINTLANGITEILFRSELKDWLLQQLTFDTKI